jgi:hypothetical protein
MGRNHAGGKPMSGTTWYHGSPFRLTSLLPGSTITQDRRLAEIFSHKPEIVCIKDNGTIKHNGNAAGLLYGIAETIQPGDIFPHPRTTMLPGKEWLTRRELKVILIGSVETVKDESLTEEEIEELRNRRLRA